MNNEEVFLYVRKKRPSLSRESLKAMPSRNKSGMTLTLDIGLSLSLKSKFWA